MIIRRLMVLLAAAFVTAYAGQGLAQSAFPAPLPGQAGSRNDPAFPPVPGQTVMRNDPAFPPVNASPRARANDPAFPPVNGAAPAASVGAAPTSFPVNGAAPLTGAGFERPAFRLPFRQPAFEKVDALGAE